MSRVSEQKVILQEELHEHLIADYTDLLDELIEKYPVSDAFQFKKLVNFNENKTLPIHSWYEYKQGYAKSLVKEIISQEKPNKNDYILDPFCGVGTTNLVSKSMGYDSIGFDINPMAFFAAKVKLHDYTDTDVASIKDYIKGFHSRKKWKLKSTPKVVDSSFLPRQYNQLLSIKGYIESLEDNPAKNVLNLAYLSIIEDASIRMKDGNGIKLKNNKKQIDDLYLYFLNKCKKMLDELLTKQFPASTKRHIFNSSILVDESFEKIKSHKVGLSVFSPPYANCFDYCEVYKLEFWMGGFVESYAGFAKYRSIALRSHVNSKFDHFIKNYQADVDLVANLIGTFNIWNKNIPDMLRGYFDDMHEILARQFQLMTSGAKCYIVVANSAYKGIMVPTDLLLAKIAVDIGYQFVDIMYARKIRASVQQMIELNARYGNLMRESIIELRKP